MKRISLLVPQGLGDIFWIYQKFSPYYEVIDFRVAVLSHDPVQMRSESWLSLFPKCGDVTFQIVTTSFYNEFVAHRYSLPNIINAGLEEATYCCNADLEYGVRIEDIDPDYPIEQTVDIEIVDDTYEETGFHKYLLLYVSEGARHKRAHVWPLERWVDFIKHFYYFQGVKLPIVIIGASFDSYVSNFLAEKISDLGIEVKTLIDLPPKKVCGVIKNSYFFINYQSGLSVIADNFDKKQLMIYFPHLKKMAPTWAKRGNIANKIYNYAFFDDPMVSIIEKKYSCFRISVI